MRTISVKQRLFGVLSSALAILISGSALADHAFVGADLDAGEGLYQTYCGSCHGAQLEGQPNWRTAGPDGVLPAPPHDATGHTWHHDTQMLFDYTKFGGQATLEARGVTGFPSGMPAFEGQLSDRQIMDVLAFIRSTWPQQAQDFQSSRSHEE